ncbi:hypothetical protein AAZX31_13G003200 [Glycine max]
MMVSMTHRGACGCGCEANTGDSTSPVLQGVVVKFGGCLSKMGCKLSLHLGTNSGGTTT